MVVLVFLKLITHEFRAYLMMVMVSVFGIIIKGTRIGEEGRKNVLEKKEKNRYQANNQKAFRYTKAEENSNERNF